MIVRVIAALAALFSVSASFAQSLPAEADLRRHIEILASDEFEGREPGTAGEALAVSYIATQFSQAGLLPGFRGNYFQPVALVSRADDHATFRVEGANGSQQFSGEILALGDREEVVLNDLPLIFVGHALDVRNSDDGTGDDRRYDGQAVLMFRDQPEGREDGPTFDMLIAHFRERGASAIIGIADPDIPWEAAMMGMRFRQTFLASHPLANVEGVMSWHAAAALLDSAGLSLPDMAAAAAAEDFAPVSLGLGLNARVSTAFDRYDGINVVARLPGLDGSGETVLFSAHHDHFGICRPDSTEDRICNGAVDNASGTAALIETARALAAGPRPPRDMLFVTTTAEEDGLLGAQAFVQSVPVPLDRIVAAFNLDTIAIAPAGAPVGIIGRGMTPLDSLIDRVAGEQSRATYRGLDVNAFVQRHDGWAFYQYGVPAVMVGGSFTDSELLTGFLRSRYHRYDDDMTGIELGGALEDTLLHIALGRAFGDPSRYPGPRR
ncbi:M28 family peptidase [Parasphingopyxis lamellibrachiae]|uniref:Peptidase M28-like protein n=1 Tax=Parasphingopyxis lamellibrachiae TaxID=680125 RepID=A0A3D9FDJ3_9SPHN|nr:M28 family peptidase [Parasphingopyxis lamellibrachiae]RED15642.1 peptidase M28-like protein [Parasphingopyxis lamellibrachiae]